MLKMRDDRCVHLSFRLYSFSECGLRTNWKKTRDQHCAGVNAKPAAKASGQVKSGVSIAPHFTNSLAKLALEVSAGFIYVCT
jgi:hypothetical protein